MNKCVQICMTASLSVVYNSVRLMLLCDIIKLVIYGPIVPM